MMKNSFSNDKVERKIISNEELINNEKLSIIEYKIIVFPDNIFKVSLLNDVDYTLESFEDKIISKLISKYPEFKELSSLKIVKYYKRENSQYIPTEISITNIPNTLYIELTSKDAWVKTDFNIEMNNYNIRSEVLLLFNRTSSDEYINSTLMRIMITIWNTACQEYPEVLQYYYLITEFKILHSMGQLSITSKETKNSFSFHITIKSTLISVEEYTFKFLQDKYKNITKDEKWDNFNGLKSFDNFYLEPTFEEEFICLKTLVRSQIIKLSNSNLIFLFFANAKLENCNNDLVTSGEDEQLGSKLNVVIIGKVSKRTKASKKCDRKSFKLNIDYISRPSSSSFSSNIEPNIMNKNRFKNYRENYLDEYLLVQERTNPEHMNELRKYSKHKASIEGVNYNAKMLYKHYEEEKEINKDLEIKKEYKDKQYISLIQSITTEFTKNINENLISNIIENNTSIKLQRNSLNTNSIPKFKDFKYKIFITRELKQLQEEINLIEKEKTSLNILWYTFLVILIIAIIGAGIYFIVE